MYSCIHFVIDVLFLCRVLEGLIAERYCFKVTLILLALATIDSENQESIVDTIVGVLLQLSGQFHKLEEKPAGGSLW